jgi:hypothetical protein
MKLKTVAQQSQEKEYEEIQYQGWLIVVWHNRLYDNWSARADKILVSPEDKVARWSSCETSRRKVLATIKSCIATAPVHP